MNSMNLYIHPENQTLLWQTINKSPYFASMKLSTSDKEKWFQSIIEHFYLNHNNRTLKELNRDTILFMMEQITPPPRSVIPNVSSRVLHHCSFKTPDEVGVLSGKDGQLCSFEMCKGVNEKRSTPEPLMDDKQKQQQTFIELQKEYEKMLNKQPPKNIDFTEKIEEDPISQTHTNDLIEKHRKERDNIYMEFSSPPPSGSAGAQYASSSPPPSGSAGTQYASYSPPPSGSAGAQYASSSPPPSGSAGASGWAPPPQNIKELFDMIKDIREELKLQKEMILAFVDSSRASPQNKTTDEIEEYQI